MELEDFFEIVRLPLIFLLFFDFLDFYASHYSLLKAAIDQTIIDAIFFLIAIPVYAFVGYTVIIKSGGDREDVAISTFLLSGSKWLIGWIGAWVFFFFLSSGGQSMLPVASTAISDPFANFLTLQTAMQFGWHVIGAGIGGLLLGLGIEKFVKKKVESAPSQ